jgi:hypothetical protein
MIIVFLYLKLPGKLGSFCLMPYDVKNKNLNLMVCIASGILYKAILVVKYHKKGQKTINITSENGIFKVLKSGVFLNNY